MALSVPFASQAQEIAATNHALTKTRLTYSATTDDTVAVNRFRVPFAGCGKTMPFTENDSYSVSFWVNRTAETELSTYKSSAVLASMGTAQHANFNGHFVFSVDDEGTLSLGGWGLNNGGSGDVDGKTLSLNTWTFFCITYDNPNKKFRVYMNDELVYDKNLTAAGTYNESGEMPACFQFGAFGFSGMIDNVALYNRALDQDEALVAYYAPQKMTDEVVSLYEFEDPTDLGKNSIGEGTDFGAQFERYVGSHGEGTSGGVAGTAGGSNTIVIGDDEFPYAKITEITTAEGTEYMADSYEMPAIPSKTITIPALPAYDHATVVLKDKEGNPLAAGQEITYEFGDQFFVESTADEGWLIVDTERLLRHLTTSDHFYPVYNERDWREIALTVVPEVVNLTVENENNYPVVITVTDAEGNAVDPVDLAAIPYGATVTVAPSASTDLLLDNVELDGAALTAADGVYSFERPNADCTLTLTSHAVGSYKVLIARTEGGTGSVTDASGAEIASGSYVAEGTVLTIAATPAEGNECLLQINGSRVSAPCTYTVTEETKIGFTFSAAEAAVESCDPTPVSGRPNGSNANSVSGRQRGATSLTVAGGTTGNSMAITAGGADARAVYQDATSQQMVVVADETVTLTVAGSGSWMNTFIYADFDGDGLDSDDQVATNCDWDTDLTTNPNKTGEHSNAVAGTFTFAVPGDIQPGVYRVRYMLNWDRGQGPCEYGQTSNDNGEQIIDFNLVVEDPNEEPLKEIYELTGINVVGDGTVTVSSSADGAGIVYEKGDGLFADAPIYFTFTPDADRAFVSGTVNNGYASTPYEVGEDENAAVSGSETVAGDIDVSGIFGTESTGIDGIEADEADEASAVYYNLQGVRVNRDNLSTGIYIRKAGKKVTKVLITK